MDFRKCLISCGEQTLKVFFRNLFWGALCCKWESECFYHVEILTCICVTAKEKLGDCYLSLFCFLREKIFKNSESLIYVICNLNFPVFETFLVRLIKFSFLQVFSMLWFMLYVSKVLAFISPLCVAWEAEAHRDFACSLWSLFKLLCSCGLTSLLLGPLKSVRGGFSCPAQPHLSTLITTEAVTTVSQHLGVGSKVFLTSDLGS